MLYKTIKNTNKKVLDFDVIVNISHEYYSESWRNIDEALDELGQYNFKIVSSVVENGNLIGLILCSETMTHSDDIERIIEKLKDKINLYKDDEKKKSGGWIDSWHNDITELISKKEKLKQRGKIFRHLF